MKLRALLLLPLALAACAAPKPTFTQRGVLAPGATIVVRNIQGDIAAYAPEHDQPDDEYTVQAYEPANASHSVVSRRPLLLSVFARAPGVRYLIRGPKNSALDLRTQTGTINVADYDGIVNAQTGRGDVKMLIPQYGSVSVGRGNISVIFASTDWPGTVHFTTRQGDVELYVNEKASAHVHLHTADGTIFSDFPLKGTSSGHSETIDSDINGGASRTIDVEVGTGDIRVLQLKPQI